MTSQSGLPNTISGVSGLATDSDSIWGPNLIKSLVSSLVISEATFAFYLTDMITYSYFDIGAVD